MQRWHKALIEGGLGARTVTNAHKLLHRVLADAVKNGTIARNIAEIHKPPKVEAVEIEILAPEQIADVLAKLEGHTLSAHRVAGACHRHAARRAARAPMGRRGSGCWHAPRRAQP